MSPASTSSSTGRVPAIAEDLRDASPAAAGGRHASRATSCAGAPGRVLPAGTRPALQKPSRQDLER